jgi:xylulokinase
MPSAGKEGRIAHRKHVLSIDLGSGGLKTAIVADTGSVVTSAEVPLTTHLLPGGGAEQDPAEWWQGVRQTARQAITESGLASDDIVAVACDSQWSVAVPVDAHGDPLMRAVHWMDTRGGPYNRAIASGFPRIQGYGLAKLLKWLRLTGLAPTLSGVDSLGHVLFIKHACPEIYARTQRFWNPWIF